MSGGKDATYVRAKKKTFLAKMVTIMEKEWL